MQTVVSVIIPCYNQSEYLGEALDSVLLQTYPNWECIIVNDGSTDETEKVAMQYTQKDKRFKYIYQQNGGVSRARNFAIANSRGEYILPLDGDDKIGERYLELAIAHFRLNPTTKVVYCRANFFGNKNEEWLLTPYDYKKLIWANILFCSAVYRRCDYNKTKGYNENMKCGLEDWDFWLSLIHNGDVVYQLNEVMFFYRLRDKSRNVKMEQYFNALCEQIYFNHEEIYAPYVKNIIYYYQMKWRAEELVYNKEQEIRSSLSYKIGSVILAPLKFIKHKICL